MKLFPFSRFNVYGGSMLPTLKPGQDILCFNWTYGFSKPKIGDVVVVKISGRVIIKRIQSCNSRQIFVTGDNRGKSTDSRSFGWVEKEDILGKVIWSN